MRAHVHRTLNSEFTKQMFEQINEIITNRRLRKFTLLGRTNDSETIAASFPAHEKRSLNTKGGQNCLRSGRLQKSLKTAMQGGRPPIVWRGSINLPEAEVNLEPSELQERARAVQPVRGKREARVMRHYTQGSLYRRRRSLRVIPPGAELMTSAGALK